MADLDTSTIEARIAAFDGKIQKTTADQVVRYESTKEMVDGLVALENLNAKRASTRVRRARARLL